MKKSDNIRVGAVYIVKVSGALVPVRLESASPYGGWIGRNIRTGREVRIRTAAKLRREVTMPSPVALGVGYVNAADRQGGLSACVLMHHEWGFLSALPQDGGVADWSLEPLHACRFASYEEAATIRATHWPGNEHVKIRLVDPRRELRS